MFSILVRLLTLLLFFFFNDTATTEIYTLSLHDALPISSLTVPIICIASPATLGVALLLPRWNGNATVGRYGDPWYRDRKSTRLNSSHGYISYAVFCLKKKKNLHIPSQAPSSILHVTDTA